VFGRKRRDERVVPGDEPENARQSAPAAPRSVSPGRVVVIPVRQAARYERVGRRDQHGRHRLRAHRRAGVSYARC